MAQISGICPAESAYCGEPGRPAALTQAHSWPGEEAPAKPRGNAIVEKPVAGRISLRRLQHKAPGRAERQYRSGTQALNLGQLDRAKAALEKAVAADPEYIEAQNNLGTCLLKLGDAPAALDRFSRAVDLDPSSVEPQTNAAAALFMLKRYAEAEAAARRALTLDRSFSNAHVILAASLIAQNRPASEIREHLRAARDEFPEASRMISVMLERDQPLNESSPGSH